VILIGGLEPQADAKEFGLKCGISCSMAGWYTERHPKLDPVATMTEGIYIAGCAQGPKDIPASVAQGAAAAARILGKIEQKEVELEPIRASVIEEKCSGCRICNGLCPFNAITFHEDRMVTEINPALCQGCGTCVAACPAGAIVGSGFTNEQIFAQIDGILMTDVGPVEVPA
jgi:heterodisulfide reductase subunit A